MTMEGFNYIRRMHGTNENLSNQRGCHRQTSINKGSPVEIRIFQVAIVPGVEGEQPRDADGHQCGDGVTEDEVPRLGKGGFNDTKEEDSGCTKGCYDDGCSVNVTERRVARHDGFDQEDGPKRPYPGEQQRLEPHGDLLEPCKRGKRQSVIRRLFTASSIA